MTLMPARQCLIEWSPRDPNLKPCRVRLHAAYGGVKGNREYINSGGAAWTKWKTATDSEVLQFILTDYVGLTKIYGIEPDDVHAEFMKIDLYAKHMLDEGIDYGAESYFENA